MIYETQIGDATRTVELVRQPDGAWQVSLDGNPLAVDVATINAHTVSLLLDSRSYTFTWDLAEKSPASATYALAAAGREAAVEVRDPRRALAQRHVQQSGRVRLKSPMAGKVVRLLAAVGDAVEAGQGLIVLEAMKMQNEVRSPKSGTLVACPATPGQTVASGELLAEVE